MRLADSINADADDLGDRHIAEGKRDELQALGDFPRFTWRQGETWRRRLARSCDDLASDLEGGQSPYPRCPAEKAALFYVIDLDADAALKDAWWGEGFFDGLPQGEDFQWDEVYQDVFQDLDIQAVFASDSDRRLDGIEDPEFSPLPGQADYRPNAWFDWFDNVEPRDPARLLP